MLSRVQIKQQAKYAVYTHMVSCILIMILTSLFPTLVLTVMVSPLIKSMQDMASFSVTVGQSIAFCVVYLASIVLNTPFQYCAMRYFLILSGTPSNKKCSVKVYFSGTENIGSMIKGALSVILFSLLSCIGIFVGFFPVYLAFCMAPFYIAVNSEMSVFQALSKSRELMKGHKKEAFVIIAEFMIAKVIAALMMNYGMSIFPSVIDIVSSALLYTALAVIFVRLDIEKKHCDAAD